MTWIQNAKVGDKVVALSPDESGLEPNTNVRLVEYGATYTIRCIQSAARNTGKVEIGLLFEEIKRVPLLTTIGMFEADFNWRCFRPVEPRRYDISIFTDMLNTAPSELEEA